MTVFSTPSTFELLSAETLQLSIDMTNQVVGADAPSAPTATLTNIETGTAQSGVGTPTTSTNNVLVTLTNIPAGRYRLVTCFETGGNTRCVATLIEVAF